MAGKRKDIDKNGAFQVRFRELWSNYQGTQEQLADALDVSRPTISGWLDGRSIPDIISLTKISRLFRVSSDYLLGLSDTKTPDMTSRAAVAYTGLSEAAVEWLHIGIDDFECDGVGISEEEKRQNWRTASALIQNRSFTDMIYNLKKVAQHAYLEKALDILYEQHFESEQLEDEDSDDFCFAKNEDREAVINGLIQAFSVTDLYLKDEIPDMVHSMDDNQLANCVINGIIDNREDNALRQFHAAKAFTNYIDKVVKSGQRNAEKRFSLD